MFAQWGWGFGGVRGESWPLMAWQVNRPKWTTLNSPGGLEYLGGEKREAGGSQFKKHYVAEMWSSEEGSYLRRIDFCITRL